MSDIVAGTLEIATLRHEVIINHPDLKPDEQGVGHIVFSPEQARHLAQILLKQARIAEDWIAEQREQERRASIPPVDRTAQTLTDGSPVTDDHREIDSRTGMQKAYVVLSEEERSKGFVRPVRRTYVHLKCNTTTTMSMAIAETYARDPYFYSGTMCRYCSAHFPLDQFVWYGTTEMVGS